VLLYIFPPVGFIFDKIILVVGSLPIISLAVLILSFFLLKNVFPDRLWTKEKGGFPTIERQNAVKLHFLSLLVKMGVLLHFFYLLSPPFFVVIHPSNCVIFFRICCILSPSPKKSPYL
jgi:hypothetical protein